MIKEMYLYGESEIQYKQTDLTAANIKVNFETGGVEAEGVPTDTCEKYVGTPVFKDKGETYEGFRMKFNFKSQRGFIATAGTENEGAYYTGSKIKKVDKDTYFIQDGIYTTCDKKDPDYYLLFSQNESSSKAGSNGRMDMVIRRRCSVSCAFAFCRFSFTVRQEFRNYSARFWR